MAIVSGSKIVDDGLIFHYDMENANSYKGPPCENLVPTSAMRTCSGDFTYQEWHVEQFFYETTTDKGRNDVKRIWCNPTKTGAQPYADFGFQAYRSGGTQIGDVYQVSFDYKDIVSWNTGGAGLSVYANGYKLPDATDVGTVNSTTITPLGNGWYRTSYNVTVTAAGNTWWRFGFDSRNFYIDKLFDNFQIIYAGVDSSFVDGTRSATGVLSNLAGNSYSFSANNLEYLNDGTFNFTGPGAPNTYVNVTPAGTYPSSWTDPFSLEAWIKIPNGADWHDTTVNTSSGTCIVARGGYDGCQGLFTEDAVALAGRLKFRMRNNGTQYGGSTADLEYDTWYHIAGTFNGGTTSSMRLYLNGDLYSVHGFTNTGGSSPGASATWYIGGVVILGGNYGGYITGSIPIVRAYSKALTDAEVAQNFNASRTRFGI